MKAPVAFEEWLKMLRIAPKGKQATRSAFRLVRGRAMPVREALLVPAN